MQIDVVRNFLTADECQAVIQETVDRFSRATVVGSAQQVYSQARTAESAWLAMDSVIGQTIRCRVAERLGVPEFNLEQVSVVRYFEGGEYRPHVDWFDPASESYMACTLFGGQRTHSVLMYLNDEFTGGETDFPNVAVTVRPEVGKAVVWSSDVGVDQDSLHAGLPVVEGVKYIAIVWVRERRFV